MRKILLAAILLTAGLVMSGAALASGSYRFPKGVVVEGDTVAALIKRAGKPDRVVQLENRYGAGDGERWEYYFDTVVVAFTIRGSNVVEITESR